MTEFISRNDGIVVHDRDTTIRIRAWGRSSFRIQHRRGPILDDLPHALLDQPAADETSVDVSESGVRVVHGDLVVEVDERAKLVFRDAAGRELLREVSPHPWHGPRSAVAVGNGYARLTQTFAAYEDERLFGLGQRMHGLLDQKGTVLDLAQRNGEVSIPFMVSSRGYGFLWNSPAVGRVELGRTATRWVSDAARQVDYWITAGDPSTVLGAYADATGHPSEFPAWAAGLWQSKLRYEDQTTLEAVSEEYAARGLPSPAVLVADYFSWSRMGDWRFDENEWPDVPGMVERLGERGTRLLVSVWPTISPSSENAAVIRDKGLAIGTENGLDLTARFPDKGVGDGPVGLQVIDSTNPEARKLLWGELMEHYVAHGIRLFWLDACEPEIVPEQYANLRFAAGVGTEVATVYPREHTRAIYEGLRSIGEDAPIALVRSAWAGSQRYGALLWSGDIPATWESLRVQLRAGLNAGLAGIPWWTTDTGGFHGGDASDPAYQELMLRWFQWMVYSPILRLHGHRDPRGPFVAGHSGGPNEPWAFGTAYPVLREQLLLRERLRPYVVEQMRTASKSGVAPMRPLFVDHPGDEQSWLVDDVYHFGPDLIVAPVLEPDARSRDVYLPPGQWCHAESAATHHGGETVTVPVSREAIPVFVRAGAVVLDVIRQSAGGA